MRWRELLLESRYLAVLSAAGAALIIIPANELAGHAQPVLAKAAAPTPLAAEPVPSKGPLARRSGPSAMPVLAAPEAASPPAAVTQRHLISQTPAARVPASPSAASPTPVPSTFQDCLQAQNRPECRRAFEAAIASNGGAQLASPRERLGTQPLHTIPTLAFDEDPQWQRRVESIVSDGLTFKRMRRGPDHELVFGLSSDGVLGFRLEEIASRR